MHLLCLGLVPVAAPKRLSTAMPCYEAQDPKKGANAGKNGSICAQSGLKTVPA